jgi:hypothetical protein
VEHARRGERQDDAHRWRVLATRNTSGRTISRRSPRLETIGPAHRLIDIWGREHTRGVVIADAAGPSRPAEHLTPGRLASRCGARARCRRSRRASRSAPRENSDAEIDASGVEPPRVPATSAPWAGVALRAATGRDLASTVAAVSGGGDVIWLTGRLVGHAGVRSWRRHCGAGAVGRVAPRRAEGRRRR